MTLEDLKILMAEARTHGISCVDLAAHPEIDPFWSYETVSRYLCPGYAGPGPSKIFRTLAAQALRDLIARALETAKQGAAA